VLLVNGAQHQTAGQAKCNLTALKWMLLAVLRVASAINGMCGMLLAWPLILGKEKIL
jgi:hypothetical protein